MKKIYLLLSLLLIVLASCKKDDSLTVPALTGDEVEVEFNSPIAYGSRAGESVEQRIPELDLVVFDKDGKYQYTRQAYSSNYATFRSILIIDSDLTIYFFANSRSLLKKYEEENVLAEGALLSQLETKLLLDNPTIQQSGTIALPMWGKLTDVTLSDSQVNNLGEVKLLRSVASAEIIFSVPESTFEFTEIYVYNPATAALMVPHSSTYDSNLQVSAPYCLDEFVTGYRYDYSEFVENQSVIETVYMFENDANETKNRKRTRLVVGGKYQGGNTTYYPLDFKVKDSSNQDVIMDIMRNHKYILEVTAVNSEGWDNPDDAAEAAAVNLEYKVIDWTESTDGTIIIDGPDYVSIESRSVTLYADAGSSKSLSFSTSVPVENIDMDFTNESGTDILNSEQVVVGTENDHYQAELIFDSQSITHLRIIAPAEYNAAHASEKLTIIAGRIKLTVSINRQADGEYDWGNGGNNEVVIGD
ncbi:MAG: fimbrial protein [Tannerellaceae bacterium]|nr:fimbrial protein [Tannerellaceae bacterium]